MSTNTALRNFLQSGPGALARAIGDPAIRAALSRDSTTALEGQVTPADGEIEAHADLFDEGDELVIIADLPSASPDNVRVYAYPTRVAIHLRHLGRRCVYQMPTLVQPASLRCAMRNGLLEVRLGKR